MAFSDEEFAYLQSQPVARLATVNEDGQPDVVPVAFELDGSDIWVGGVGAAVLRTRKFRNIGAGRVRAESLPRQLPTISEEAPHLISRASVRFAPCRCITPTHTRSTVAFISFKKVWAVRGQDSS